MNILPVRVKLVLINRFCALLAERKAKETIKKSKTATGVSAKFKNNSKKKWQFIHATCIFYDSKGRAIGESSQYLHCEKPKSSVSAVFSQPRDTKSYQPLKWKSYKIFIDYAYKYRSAK